MQNKYSYFQGTEPPTPKKPRYKPDASIVVQPRFIEPFYKNNDLYETKGKHTPGAGYHQLTKYKSVKDFLKNKRKKLKNKYKAKDSWNNKSKLRKKKIKSRAFALNNIIKQSIDFAIDDMIQSGPILGESGTYSDIVPIGGYLDEYLPLNDFEGKSPDKLNFGRDYVEGEEPATPYLDYLMFIFSPKEPDLLLQNGFDPEEDLDADRTIFDMNPDYDITDSGNTLYNKMWFV
jgi:hypothetical protein